jgi:MinD-like ATPase involved in chromosome partitioning or flagellar assembly
VRSDVRQLLQGLSDGRLHYLDVRDLERRAAGCASLGLEPPPASAPEPVRAAGPDEALHVMGPVVAAFVSASPGAGATTVAACAADLLAQEGRACGAVDLARSGALLRRLGAPAAAAGDGLSPALTRSGVHAVAARCRVEGEQAPQAIAYGWERIASALSHCACIVADVPAGGAPFEAALTTADEVVVVLRPPQPVAEALAAAASWTRAGGGSVRFLVNGFDARRAGDRALRAALEARLGPALLPFVVHEDVAIAALPEGTTLAEHAPESQALRDLGELAAWLLRRATAQRTWGR